MSQEGGRSAWLKAVMKAKKPGMSLGDAMKAAKKTYKKGGAEPDMEAVAGALDLPAVGGRRRRTRRGGADPEMEAVAGALDLPAVGGRRRRSRRGGAEPDMEAVAGALGLPPMGGRRRRSRKAKVGGTAYGFTGGPYTGSQLSDGMGAFPKLPDATYQGHSELKGGRRRSRRSHRGGADVPSTDGKPAELPGAKSADAPATAVSPAGTLPSGASAPSPFSKGGRRRRHTKKAGRGYY
jgi:hypothetical protein